MYHIFLHALKHSALDALKLLPFLFLTYFIMELLEHNSGEKSIKLISRSGKVGPIAGGLLGALPQCGFSASGASLYSGRVITLGTLIAIFLSTSDEMIPVMISNRAHFSAIAVILITKIILGIASGFAVDLIFRREPVKIDSICEAEGCHCEDGILLSALRHSLNVFIFVFVIGFGLELLIGTIGEDAIASFVSASRILSNLISATVGLIPNCAASVVITELYLEGVISAGAMMSGLLTGAGVGTVVLFRTNKDLKENLLIIAGLWAFGFSAGTVLDLVNFGALL